MIFFVYSRMRLKTESKKKMRSKHVKVTLAQIHKCNQGHHSINIHFYMNSMCWCLSHGCFFVECMSQIVQRLNIKAAECVPHTELFCMFVNIIVVVVVAIAVAVAAAIAVVVFPFLCVLFIPLFFHMCVQILSMTNRLKYADRLYGMCRELLVVDNVYKRVQFNAISTGLIANWFSIITFHSADSLISVEMMYLRTDCASTDKQFNQPN